MVLRTISFVLKRVSEFKDSSFFESIFLEHPIQSYREAGTVGRALEHAAVAERVVFTSAR
jgi:hypothetical protein